MNPVAISNVTVLIELSPHGDNEDQCTQGLYWKKYLTQANRKEGERLRLSLAFEDGHIGFELRVDMVYKNSYSEGYTYICQTSLTEEQRLGLHSLLEENGFCWEPGVHGLASLDSSKR